jgi:hypothetical protein
MNIMTRKSLSKVKSLGRFAAINVSLLWVSGGCTGQIPDSFRLAQEEELKNLQDVNTKVDILWVVDNSASMDVSQERLRQGFASFAATYMKPTWDIRMGIITTDSYLANNNYSAYWATVLPGTVGWTSPYIAGRLGTFVNPTSNPTLVNTGTGVFTNGVRIRDQYPLLGRTYAQLLSGVHDGPIPALCSELHTYFYSGTSNCRVRDDQTGNTGTSNCITPAGAETATTQCVNTVQNNSVRSGKAIINTMPPSGTAGDAAWTAQLVRDFAVNVSVGSSGNGSERGLSSVLQFLDDNETNAPTALFRADSVRVVIFVSDEEDQSMTDPTPLPGGFSPQTNYAGGCPAKTVDGHTYTLSVCPDAARLIPVADVKTRLDSFFNAVDGAPGSSANSTYFVVSILPLTGASILQLQTARTVEDMAVAGSSPVSVDRGDRYLALGTQVGNGSLSLDLATADYTPLLDSIGRAIAFKRSVFTLRRAPTSSEDMIVRIIRADNSYVTIPAADYNISGVTLTITNIALVLSLSSTDKIYINYQPRSVL